MDPTPVSLDTEVLVRLSKDAEITQKCFKRYHGQVFVCWFVLLFVNTEAIPFFCSSMSLFRLNKDLYTFLSFFLSFFGLKKDLKDS